MSIDSFEAKQDETRLTAQGDVTPEPEGRVRGDLTIALAGPDVSGPGKGGAFGGLAPIVATALRFVGETTEIDGKPAVTGKLSLHDGKAYLGNFPVADVPRLY